MVDLHRHWPTAPWRPGFYFSESWPSFWQTAGGYCDQKRKMVILCADHDFHCRQHYIDLDHQSHHLVHQEITT